MHGRGDHSHSKQQVQKEYLSYLEPLAMPRGDRITGSSAAQ